VQRQPRDQGSLTKVPWEMRPGLGWAAHPSRRDRWLATRFNSLRILAAELPTFSTILCNWSQDISEVLDPVLNLGLILHGNLPAVGRRWLCCAFRLVSLKWSAGDTVPECAAAGTANIPMGLFRNDDRSA
jgi:hypothetical protein